VQDRQLHRVGDRRAGAAVKDSENFRCRPARGFLRRPTRHSLSDRIEKGDIAGRVRANNSVADRVECDLSAFLLRK